MCRLCFLARLFYFPNSYYQPAVFKCAWGQYLFSRFCLREWGKRGKSRNKWLLPKGEKHILWRIIITCDNYSLPSNNHLLCASVSRDSEIQLAFLTGTETPRRPRWAWLTLFSDITAPTELFPKQQTFVLPKAFSSKASSFQQVCQVYTWLYPGRGFPFHYTVTWTKQTPLSMLSEGREVWKVWAVPDRHQLRVELCRVA